MKNEIRERLEILAEIQTSEMNTLTVVESDWKKYGKDRTYFKIVRTRPCSKHYSEFDFGYFDNIEQKYISGRDLNALDHNHTLLYGEPFDLDGEFAKRHIN